MATSIVDSGSYDLLIDTGFIVDGFTLDDTLKGVLDNTGSMNFNLLDGYAGGVFNPFNQDSPYFDTANAQPGLAPMRNVILTREGEELFNGYIIDYTYDFNLGGLDEVNVQCADRFYVLSQTYMDEYNVSEQLANVRIEAVLDLPEVNAFQMPGERNI